MLGKVTPGFRGGGGGGGGGGGPHIKRGGKEGWGGLPYKKDGVFNVSFSGKKTYG